MSPWVSLVTIAALITFFFGISTLATVILLSGSLVGVVLNLAKG